MKSRNLCVAAIAMMSSGCYVYQPVATGAVPAGSYARVELTDAGAETVKAGVGSGALWLEGDVREVREGGLTLALRAVTRRELGESVWSGETMALGTADIRSITIRRSSRGRTTLAATLLGGAGIGVIWWIAHATGQSSGSTGRPVGTPP